MSKSDHSPSITPQADKKMSEEQIAFNEINEKIRKQAEKFENDKNKFDHILQSFNAKILPYVIEVAREKINTALILHEISVDIKWNKNQKKQLGEAIVFLMEKGFEFHEPTLEEKNIYDFWSPQTYKEMEEAEIALQKAILKSTMENLGVNDIDLDDFDPNDPEKMAEIQEKLKEAQKIENDLRNKAGSKKSKRQLQKEEKEKALQSIQKKGLREIYIGLAKVFHPDSSATTVDDTQKEELMKQVSIAYESGDLTTLLKIEAAWIAKQENDINHLNADKLKIYINLLRKQLSDMEKEYFLIRNDSRYFNIRNFMSCALPVADKKITGLNKELKSILSLMQSDNRNLKAAKDKNTIMNFVGNICQLIYEEENSYHSG